MLCSLSRRLPPLTARFLERAPLGRNFREETVTDLLTGAFAGLSGLGLRVGLPDEKKTGADMEWWFVNPTTGKRLRILIQAKRATKGKTWASARFTELAHPHNSGRQCSDLIVEAGRTRNVTLALYAFYCPETVVDEANLEAGRPLTGIDFASAHFISTLIAKDRSGKLASRNAGKTRYAWPSRKLAVIRPRLFTLHDLLCFPKPPVLIPATTVRRGTLSFQLANGLTASSGFLRIPTPEDILARLAKFQINPKDFEIDQPQQSLDAPLPGYVRQLFDGGVEDLSDTSRPYGRRVVVFQAGNENLVVGTFKFAREKRKDPKTD